MNSEQTPHDTQGLRRRQYVVGLIVKWWNYARSKVMLVCELIPLTKSAKGQNRSESDDGSALRANWTWQNFQYKLQGTELSISREPLTPTDKWRVHPAMDAKTQNKEPRTSQTNGMKEQEDAKKSELKPKRFVEQQW